MTNSMKAFIPALLCFLLSMALLEFNTFGSTFSDPGVANGEQIVWRGITPDKKTILSTVTWRVKDKNGKPVYEITTDSGSKKYGRYIIDKSDLRLIWVHVLEETKDGKSEITIESKDDHQYLIHNFKNKHKDKKIGHYLNGYNGIILPFSLRGFPFGKQKEVKIRLTPPFGPGMPFWTWTMWKSYVKYLGEEKVTVPAGTFDCYKLEVMASSRLIKRFTSKHYFWYTKEPPHWFVKFQGKDSMTELMEIRSMGKE